MLVRSEEIGRAYALRLIGRIDVYGERIVVSSSTRKRLASAG